MTRSSKFFYSLTVILLGAMIGVGFVAGVVELMEPPARQFNVTVVEPVGPAADEIRDAVADCFLVNMDTGPGGLLPLGLAFITREGNDGVTVMATAGHVAQVAMDQDRQIVVRRMGRDQHPSDELYRARGVYVLPDCDIGVIMVDAELSPRTLTTLTPLLLAPGTTIYAFTFIGGPDNLSMTVGAVLKGDAENTVLPIHTLMHTAITNPGSSGSPVMVYRGGQLEIVGVTSFIYPINNISGAVPIQHVLADLDRLALPMPPGSYPNE